MKGRRHQSGRFLGLACAVVATCVVVLLSGCTDLSHPDMVGIVERYVGSWELNSGTFDGGEVSEEDYQDDAKLGTLGPLKLVYKAELQYDEHIILFMRQYLDFTLSYYRETGEPVPLMELEDAAPVPKGTQIPFPIVSRQRAQELSDSSQVKNMGIWPRKDSVQRIGDTIVVKLSEP